VTDENDSYGVLKWSEGILTAYSTWFGLAALGAVAVIWFGGVEIPEIPRPVTIGGLAAGTGVGLGYLPAKKVISWLRSPRLIWLLVVQEGIDGELGIELWTFTPDAWAEIEVVEGELYQRQAIGELYEATDFDAETMEVESTWRGSASPLELVAERERIDEIRTTLEQRAKRYISLRMKVGSIVRTAVESIVNDLISSYEEKGVHRGDAIEQAVADALEQHGDPQQREESQRENMEDMSPDESEPSQNGTDADTAESTQ
jgi:hypothetical protein